MYGPRSKRASRIGRLLCVFAALVGCAESPLQPRSATSPSVPNAADVFAQAAGRRALEIDVQTSMRMPNRRSQQPEMVGSRATLRSTISATTRFVRIPLVAKASALAQRFAEIAAAYPELAPALAARQADYVLDVAQPARYATTLCTDRRRWVRRVAGAGADEMLAEGEGDSPALRTTLLRDGKEILSTTMRWRRTPSAWQLADVETHASDGSYVEKIGVRSIGASQQPLASAAPPATDTVARVACSSEELSTLPSFGARAQPSVPKALKTAAAPFGSAVAFDCSDSGDCSAEFYDYQKSQTDLAQAHAAVGLACGWLLVPTPAHPLVVGACALALVVEGIALNRAEVQRQRWWDCVHKGTLIRGVTAGGLVNATGASLRVSTGGSSTTPATMCGDGTGTDGGFPFYACHYENWQISFDGGVSWQPYTVSVCGYV